jgi:Zn-dependent M28 family amino/carboxypeptidase
LSTRLRSFPFVIALGLCANEPSIAADPTPPAPAASTTAAPLKAINAGDLLKHIKVLASDEFEGRAPGTKGETSTVAYIKQQFIQLGLASGSPDGNYVQQVPMLGATSTSKLSFNAGGKTTPLRFPDDFVAFSPRAQRDIRIDNSEMVFVGYGIVAREFDWDDYKGADLRGKTLVMLINDPPVADPKHPGKLDPAMFKGEGMTYYGRWTYKYEMAAKLGAAAAIIVHETKPAAYPYEVVVNSWSRENFNLKTDGPNSNFPAVPAWIHLNRARDLFRAGGFDFDTLKKSALSKDFKPVSLGVKATFQVQNSLREIASNNVVAKIEGSDPKLKNEYVVYSAHWDHFGINEKLPGTRTQQIFHGAQDNASGVATLLELAKAYKALPAPPKRTIVFIATTAEEQGLLGAQYYAHHPLYPLQRTLVDINIDGINTWGRTKDVEVIGLGQSTMDDWIKKIAAQQGRAVRPETRPELGLFYRADQFEFAKEGVPVVYLKSGKDYIGKPESYARDRVDEYIAHRYHKVTDTVRSDWNLAGAVEDTQLLFMLGYEVAQGTEFPQWKTGSEFKRSDKR